MDETQKQGLVYLHVFVEESIEDAEAWAQHHGEDGPKEEAMLGAMKRQLAKGVLFQEEVAQERLADYYDRFDSRGDDETIEVAARPEREWDGVKCVCPLCSEIREVQATFHLYRPQSVEQRLMYDSILAAGGPDSVIQ